MLRLKDEDINKLLLKINFKKMKGLLPVITQEASTKKILMQAFMDKEAFQLTLKTGKAHYWSRVRKKIWRKGETSGHEQIVEKAYLDCDYDTLLLQVKQIGFCCHTGEKTCFHHPITKKSEK